MRSDELVAQVRDSANIATAASWPDWTDAKILQLLTNRHYAFQSSEIIRARAGYGIQEAFVTCVVGTQQYPVPSRAVGGALEKLEFQVPGQTTWLPLEKVETAQAQLYDQGPTKPGTPRYYSIQDGFVELYQSPSAAFVLKFTFYIRPSILVTSQSSTLGGDGVNRGQITAINVGARTVTVGVVPFDQLLAVPAAITSGSAFIDIVRRNATFACAMYSQAQTLAGTVFTLTSTDDMSRVQIGDYVRVADQTDWPSNLPIEYHSMLADRAAMEILRMTGRSDDEAILATTVAADRQNFRDSIKPQVKNAPKVLPLAPYYARGRARTILPSG